MGLEGGEAGAEGARDKVIGTNVRDRVSAEIAEQVLALDRAAFAS